MAAPSQISSLVERFDRSRDAFLSGEYNETQLRREAKLDHERNTLQRQIDATDKQIDELVYELYNLSDEERRIVERE